MKHATANIKAWPLLRACTPYCLTNIMTSSTSLYACILKTLASKGQSKWHWIRMLSSLLYHSRSSEPIDKQYLHWTDWERLEITLCCQPLASPPHVDLT
jgi:hypothetical protein